jgi:hypothetical protein
MFQLNLELFWCDIFFFHFILIKFYKRIISLHNTEPKYCRYTGFDINGCPIARGKWKRNPTCPIGQVKMILWYVQFLNSKMINIELFSVGSRDEFYLNIVSCVSCILRDFVLFWWWGTSILKFSNKDISEILINHPYL